MQSINGIKQLVDLASNADNILTQNTRKIVLDMLYQATKIHTSNCDNVLSLARFSNNKTLKKIGVEKTGQINSDIQKSKELSHKVSQIIPKINEMSYEKLMIIVEQYNIGGVESAINYINNGTRIIKTKRI